MLNCIQLKIRNSHNLHLPLPHLTKYQKGVHYAGIQLFNHLPAYIKKSSNELKVYKEWVKSQTQLYYYYYVAIWWKVANNYMFRP